MKINIDQLVIKNGKCATEEALKLLCGKWNSVIINECIKESLSLESLRIKLEYIPRVSLTKKINYLISNKLIVVEDGKYYASLRAIELLDIAKDIDVYLLKNIQEISNLEEKYDYVNKMIGQKWKARILWLLLHYDTIRFNQFSRCLEGISHKILKETLNDMENTNIIFRKEYDDKILKVEYKLTKNGKEMAIIVNKLSDWSKKYNLLTQKVTVTIE